MVDAYLPGSATTLVNRNFQLHEAVTVTGTRARAARASAQERDVRRLPLHDQHAELQSQAQFMDVAVRSQSGATPVFTPWFGALAHAIFFQPHAPWDYYFHTHVCSPKPALCTVEGDLGVVAPARRPACRHALPDHRPLAPVLGAKSTARRSPQPFTLDVRS